MMKRNLHFPSNCITEKGQNVECKIWDVQIQQQQSKVKHLWYKLDKVM